MKEWNDLLMSSTVPFNLIVDDMPQPAGGTLHSPHLPVIYGCGVGALCDLVMAELGHLTLEGTVGGLYLTVPEFQRYVVDAELPDMFRLGGVLPAIERQTYLDTVHLLNERLPKVFIQFIPGATTVEYYPRWKAEMANQPVVYH